MLSRNWRHHTPFIIGLAVAVALGISGLANRANLQNAESQQRNERPSETKESPDIQGKFSAAEESVAEDKPPADQDEGKRHYNYRDLWQRTWKIISHEVKWTDAAVAIFTGLLTLIAWLQIRYTRINQRAYLSVGPMGIRQRKHGEPWFGIVGVRNDGHLPARRMNWFIRVRPFDCDKDWEPSDYDQVRKGNHVVPPGATLRFGSPTFSVDFPSEGDGWMYIWGEITYEDGLAFSKRKYTKFCHRYHIKSIDADRDGGQYIPVEDAREHIHGNDAT